jgi:thioredoxin-like negative regulator of GroEL
MCEIRRCSEMNDDDLEHLLDLADAYYARRGYSEDAAKKLLDEVRREASKDDARAAFLLGLYREQQ